jgi:molybdopterin-containing oxidoreductase family iron-sulfur binding subunit
MKKIHPTRRDSLKLGIAGLASIVMEGCGNTVALEEFLQGPLQKMSQEELAATIDRLEQKYRSRYGVDFTLNASPALEQTDFGFAIDISRCVGCRKCVYACVRENNLSRNVEIHWIRVLRMERGRFDLKTADHYYDPETVPEDGYFYLPVQCQQCEHPACVKACPVEATWQEPDGVVVIDYDWCIGCRTCMAACPYGARHFNWNSPILPAEELTVDVHLLGNRPRSKGSVEKCTFCLQRTREGLYPACVEACPAGARKFGNLLDPDSEIRYILENFSVYRLKEELNTEPRFWYFVTHGW